MQLMGKDVESVAMNMESEYKKIKFLYTKWKSTSIVIGRRQKEVRLERTKPEPA